MGSTATQWGRVVESMYYKVFGLLISRCQAAAAGAKSLDARIRLFALWIGLDFIKCTYRTYNMLLKIPPRIIHTWPVRVNPRQITSILLILCYNDSLVTWTVISLAAAKFQPLILSLDCLCGLVVRAPGYRYRGPGSIPCATIFSEK
jgi:hypothetical protein